MGAFRVNLEECLGAILREKEDAHIAAALQYAAEWLNQRGSYGHLEYLIEYVDTLDHYAAIRKGFFP